MRIIVILLTVAAVLFLGWWFVAVWLLDRGLDRSAEALRARGWTVAYETERVGGFPYRFDLRLRDVALSDPAGALAWQTPELRLDALSYRPNRVLAFFAPGQTVTLPRQTIDIVADDLRGDIRVGFAPQVPLTSLTLDSGPLRAASSLGWEISAAEGLAALRLAPDETQQEAPESGVLYDAYAQLDDLALPPVLAERLDPEGALPDRLAEVSLDARLGLDQALDRGMTAWPQVRSIELRGLEVDWGAVTIAGSGDLLLDDAGIPEGELVLRIGGWQQLIDLAEEAGLLTGGSARMVRGAASAMADGDAIEAPITFEGGAMRLGFVPLGPAPRLFVPPGG